MQHDVFQALDRKKQYRYPFLFLGLFLTFLLSTVTLANRIVDFHGMILPGGIFVFPLTFSICDIVGEVYGYAYPRLFIWIGVLAELIFSLVGITVSHLNAPEFFTHAPAWQTVYDPTLRYVGAGLTGLFVGEMTNVYLLSKLKIFFRGKYFIVRSLVSTAVGQALLTLVVDALNYLGKMSESHLGMMMLYGYLWKLGCAVLMVFPAWLMVRYLKKAESIDYYDINTDFNPFKLRLDGEPFAQQKALNRQSALQSEFPKSDPAQGQAG
ncbi:queuosine precursor transporter [Legionella geestiana]|nr:queuosine precursor transporter [Legionella geestiana]